MEFGKAFHLVGALFCVLLLVSEIYSLPPYSSSEDYEQGIREMMEELERQGLSGPMVPRAFHPSHNMMRKSQRSNLRLRFGKRSVSPYEAPYNSAYKAGDDAQQKVE